jgi:hypothetical protein
LRCLDRARLDSDPKSAFPFSGKIESEPHYDQEFLQHTRTLLEADLMTLSVCGDASEICLLFAKIMGGLTLLRFHIDDSLVDQIIKVVLSLAQAFETGLRLSLQVFYYVISIRHGLTAIVIEHRIISYLKEEVYHDAKCEFMKRVIIDILSHFIREGEAAAIYSRDIGVHDLIICEWNRIFGEMTTGHRIVCPPLFEALMNAICSLALFPHLFSRDFHFKLIVIASHILNWCLRDSHGVLEALMIVQLLIESPAVDMTAVLESGILWRVSVVFTDGYRQYWADSMKILGLCVRRPELRSFMSPINVFFFIENCFGDFTNDSQ